MLSLTALQLAVALRSPEPPMSASSASLTLAQVDVARTAAARDRAPHLQHLGVEVARTAHFRAEHADAARQIHAARPAQQRAHRLRLQAAHFEVARAVHFGFELLDVAGEAGLAGAAQHGAGRFGRQRARLQVARAGNLGADLSGGVPRSDTEPDPRSAALTLDVWMSPMSRSPEPPTSTFTSCVTLEALTSPEPLMATLMLPVFKSRRSTSPLPDELIVRSRTLPPACRSPGALGVQGQLLTLELQQVDVAAARVAQAFEGCGADADRHRRLVVLLPPAKVERPAVVLLARLAHRQRVAGDRGFDVGELAAQARQFDAVAALGGDDDPERAADVDAGERRDGAAFGADGIVLLVLLVLPVVGLAVAGGDRSQQQGGGERRVFDRLLHF
jgi:hypothetical protein